MAKNNGKGLKKVSSNEEITIGAEVTPLNPSKLGKEEPVIEVDEEMEEEVVMTDTHEEEEVVLVKPKQDKTEPVKMVKVKLSQDHRCFIGGNWYSFYEGKQVNVPENVKDILMRANLLLPL